MPRKKIVLESCPFCGGKAEIVPCYGMLKAVRVHCTECKCSTPPVAAVGEGDRITRYADVGAAELWNRRYAGDKINQI